MDEDTPKCAVISFRLSRVVLRVNYICGLVSEPRVNFLIDVMRKCQSEYDIRINKRMKEKKLKTCQVKHECHCHWL